MYVQDYYDESDWGKKWAKVVEGINYAVNSTDDRLVLNFLSAQSFPWATPWDVAYGMNQKMRKVCHDNSPRKFGIVLMDFAEPGIVAALVDKNYDTFPFGA